jgi:hypothetical protein
VGQDETAEQFTVIATYNGMLARATVTVAVAPPYFWKGVPVEGAVDKKSIKEKFDVTLTGTAGVEAAFKELSAFIQKGGLAAGVINLGDYIDLEGGLQIADAGGSTFSSGSVDWNGDIAGGHGKLSRLIVVGINSFNKKNGNDTPHVVFQFQNITHDRQMNATGSNEGGYAASDMRKYLSGPFLAGLIDAGVPDQVLWPPARKVSARTNIEDQVDPAEIQDKLWLPTAWEMGSATQHTLDETAANQARLEYYQDDPSRVKYGTSGAKQYWLASMTSDSYSAFVSIKINGAVLDSGGYLFSPMDAIGVAPAFCVYGGPDAPAGQ